MPEGPDSAGTADLAICGSRLLALNGDDILPENESVGIPRDAAAAHANTAGDETDKNFMPPSRSGNSVRRSGRRSPGERRLPTSAYRT